MTSKGKVSKNLGMTEENNTIERYPTSGRPVKEIDWEKLDSYLLSGSTRQRIAFAFGMTDESLANKIKAKYGMTFTEYSSKKYAEGEYLIEASQFQKALKNSAPGNTQMLIHLGKVRLGQKDSVPEVNQSAPNDVINDLQNTIMRLNAKLAIYEANNKPETGSELSRGDS